MTNYTAIFKDALTTLKREGRYRTFADLERIVGQAPMAQYRDGSKVHSVTVWCSNDYLGMSQHPKVLDAMHHALDSHGAGAGGTRNISGNHHTIVELEAEIADLHHKESALVFSSGYVANETALSTLGCVLPHAIIFSDDSNHASMIEGIRHSKCEKKIFRHNDLNHLESLLQHADPQKPKIVAFESVYSMGGDFSPLREMLLLAKKYNALTYLDETHAVGLYGPRGGGLAEAGGVLDLVDCVQGGLGKGFGIVGGFVSGNRDLIDVIRSYGSGFIFTTTIPPVVAAGALASVRHLKNSNIERKRLFTRVQAVRKALQGAELPVLETASHILPLMVGNSLLCKQVSDMLLHDHSIYIQPINYPTVPRGAERLRITPSPYHTEKMVEVLINALQSVWTALNLSIAA